MVQGVPLAKTEHATILPLDHDRNSSRKIAVPVNRGQGAVLKVIKSGQIRGGQRKRGVVPKLNNQPVRLLLQATRTRRYTASELQKKYAPMVTTRWVQQIFW